MLIDSQPSSMAVNVPILLNKRLWRSFLLRDRSLGIGIRRRPQVISITAREWSERLSTEDFIEKMHH